MNNGWMKQEKNWLERKREALVPLGQVQSRVNWGEGRRILVYYMTLMRELIVVESSLIEKSVKKFESRGLHEFDACYVKRRWNY
jgi:hypothetical protein